MQNLTLLFLVALFTACGSVSANRTDTAKPQVAEQLLPGLRHTIAVYPARITSLYETEAVFWGTSAKTIAANPVAISEYFKDAGKRPSARVTSASSKFGSTVMLLSIRATTRFLTFVTGNRWQTLLVTPSRI